MTTNWGFWTLVAASGWAVAVGCGGTSSDGSDCVPGTERCLCRADDSCDRGLSCASGICVDVGDGDATGGDGGSGGETDAPVCLAAELEPCVGEGNCVGVHACLADRSGWGTCECGGEAAGGTGSGDLCLAGQLEACVAPSGCVRLRECLADGTSYGSCDCGGGGTGGAGGTGGYVGVGGVAPTCSAGISRTCTGPDGCTGWETCLADGSDFGPCECIVSGTGGGGTGGSGTGGSGTGGGTPVDAHPGNSGIIPDDGGNFIKDWNVSGLIGSWFTFTDTGGSSIYGEYPDPAGYGPFGNQNGEFCFAGVAAGHEDTNWATNWGAGVAFDVCAMPADMSWLPIELQSAASPEQRFQAASCPTRLSAINSMTFTITGSWGPEMRIGFQETETQDVAPFMRITAGGTYTITPADLSVPADWDVANAGATGSSNIISIEFQVASQTADASFNFCISNVTIN